MLLWVRSALLPGAVAFGMAFMLVGARGEPPRVLPTTVITATPAPVEIDVEMTSFFPNPNPAVQAVGAPHQTEDDRRTDRAARLLDATSLSLEAPGVRVLNPNMGRHYGTYELVELVQQVGATYAAVRPGDAIEVGDLSLRKGGTIRESDGRRVHSSHRNGLDVDVRYLYRDCHMQGRLDDGTCPVGIKESLELMRMFVDGGPEEGYSSVTGMKDSMVDVIYVGEPFQKNLCRHLREHDEDAERYRDVVERLQVMGGHQAHFHVRIACPEHSKRCPPPRVHRPKICRGL